MAEAWPVEGEDPVVTRSKIEDAADLVVFDHGTIAVQKNDRWAVAALEVMETHTIDVEEATPGRMFAFRLSGAPPDDESCGP